MDSVEIDRLQGIYLANKVAIDVMHWTAKDGEWMMPDGEPVGLSVARGPEFELGSFRPDYDWNATAGVIERFEYCYLFLADADIQDPDAQVGAAPLMLAGQWECKLYQWEDPSLGKRGLYAVAESAPHAVCRAALKAIEWIQSPTFRESLRLSR